MKKILIFITGLLISVVTYGQTPFPTDDVTKKITFTETVTIDSVSKTQLYERAKLWVNKYFPGVKMSMDDAVALKLMVDGSLTITTTYDFKYKSENTVSFNMTIMAKDGKYKYVITDMAIYKTQNGSKTTQALELAYPKMTTQNKNEANTQINSEIKRLAEDLKNFMKTGVKENKEDW